MRRTSVPRPLPLSWLSPACVAWLLLAAALPAPASFPARVTTYAQMTAQLRAEAAKSPLVCVASLGKSASGRRQLWLVRLAETSSDPQQTLRLLVLCRQHGDEPASTEAMLRLIQSIASGGDPALRSELSHVTLYVIPMVNPDGAEAGTRVSGAGADLNRDWGVFSQPETRAVARAARLIRPALIVDAHNWDGSDEYNADCIEIPREMETAQGRAFHAMQQQALRDLAFCGYAVHPTAWGEDSNPHLAHRWFAHQNIPSLLVETHSGSPANRPDFERREGMYAVLVHSLARHYAAPWMKKSSRETQEAALFLPPPLPGVVRRAAALPKRAFPWLWVAGLYVLALWGMSLRRPEPSARNQSARNQSARNQSARKQTGTTPRHSCRYAHYYSFSKARGAAETVPRSSRRRPAGSPSRQASVS